MNITSSPYVFKHTVPVIFTEIYLPKKASYQGALYDTLSKGLKLHLPEENGKTGYYNHFKNNADSIKSHLEDYGHLIQDYERYMKKTEQVFFGYSIYEVDGVFHSLDEKTGEPRDYEERTSVIRIIFKPDYKKLTKEFNLTAKDIKRLSFIFFRTSGGVGKEQFKTVYKFANDEEQKFIDALHDWYTFVGFILFGYLAYEIALNVNENEDEIWVTSIFNFNVNVIDKRSKN